MSPLSLTWLKITPQHLHGELLDEIFELDDFDVILTICRNPVDRMKSEYYWQVETGVNVEDPATWVERMIRTQRDHPYIHDNHLRPQCDFLPNKVDARVFKLEEDGLSRALDCLVALGQDSSIKQWLNRWTLTADYKRSTPTSEVESAFQKCSPVIRGFYRADCEKFGYC
jgi:hypothetical protein